MNRPIVIVQPHLRYGGAERQSVALLNLLARSGHECHIVLHSATGGLLGDLDPHVKVHDLKMVQHWAIPIVALRMRRALKTIDPAFVIVKLWSSILTIALIDKLDRRHVYNYCEDLDPSDHSEYIRLGKLKQRIVGVIFRSRELLTANTRSVARSMVEVYGLAAEPLVICSAIDRAEVVRRSREMDAFRLGAKNRSNVMRICSVGSLIERKGYKTSLAALSRLGECLDVEWHIVGVGPLRDELASVARNGLTVVLHGGMSNPYGVMSDCDVLLHSARSEAFGVVLLESLAVGTPVIAADAIGPKEIAQTLGDSAGGLRLYRAGDADDLFRCLRELIARLPESWPADCISRYSLESTANRWLELASSREEM